MKTREPKANLLQLSLNEAYEAYLLGFVFSLFIALLMLLIVGDKL